MSAENKKLIWISVAVCAFILVLAIAGLFLFAPKKGGEAAPASVGNLAEPKVLDPQDYLQAPPPAPILEPAAPSEGDIIVIYGDNPASLQASPPPAAAMGAVAANSGAITATVPEPPVPATRSETSATSASASAPTATAKPSPAKPAPTATSAAKPSTAAAKKPATTAAAKTVAKKPIEEFWIQAASFTSRGRADELKENLGRRGLAALITVKDINGKSWYRVRVGPYATRREAEGWLGKIKAVPGCEEAGIWTATR